MMAIRLFTGFKTKLLFVIIVMGFSCLLLNAQMSIQNLPISPVTPCVAGTYNRFSGSYHSNLYIGNQVGTNVLLSWGQNMLTYTAGVAGNITAPTFVSTSSYAGIPYEVRSSSTGGASGPSVMGLRTSSNLYIFGNTANIASITSMAGFGSGSLINANSDVTSKLPAGVAITDVAQFAISPNAIAIVTNTGHVYILTKNVNLQGDKAVAGPAIWHHVTLSDGVSFLSGVVKFSLSSSGAFALTSSGSIYYWGAPANVNAVVNTATSYNYAYDMTAQIPAGKTVVDIVTLGQNTGSNVLFLLCNDLNVYSCGLNNDGVLGVGNATVSFNQPTFQPVSGLTNIVRIDGNTEAGLFTMGAMSTTGHVYGWGDGVACMLGIASESSFTTTYTNISPVDIYGTGGFSDFSIAGHFTIAFFTDLTVPVDQYWYVGHNTGGSIGIPSIVAPVISNAAVARLDAPATISFNCSNAQPTIGVVGTINTFSDCIGLASASQMIAVSGSNLTNVLIATAPLGFEVSTSANTGYSSSITLTGSGGTLAATNIYVRVIAGSTGTVSGNLVLSSSGANTVYLPLSGTVYPLPTIASVTGAARTGPGTVTISGTVSPAVGTTIDWYANPTGGVALATGTLSYTTGIISSTTNYYAEARNTITGCVSTARTMVTATVNAIFSAGSVGIDQSFCVGQNPAPLNSIVLASGGTGSISYQWQSSTDNIVFTDIAGATLINYTPVAPTQTIYYRRNAITAADGSIASNTVTITVNPKPVVNFN